MPVLRFPLPIVRAAFCGVLLVALALGVAGRRRVSPAAGQAGSPTPRPAGASPGAASTPSLSGTLAYVSGGDIWLLRAGFPPDRLTGTGDFTAVRWSPGGRFLLAIQAGQTLVLGLDGAARPGLSGAWLPDDSGVAVASPGGGVSLVNPADGAPTPLLPDDPARAFLPVAWSPDGGTLALTRQDLNVKAFPTAQSSWLVDRDGGNLRQLLPAGDTWPVPLGWSPDGRWLAVLAGPPQVCVSCRVDGQALAVVSADGSRITSLGVLARNAWLSWAPDGSALAAALGAGRESYRNKQVLLFHTGASAPAPLAPSDGQVAIEPAFSPDGRTVALTRDAELPGPAFANLDAAHGYPDALLAQRRIWLAPVDGGAARPLTPNLNVAEESPTWAAGGLLLSVRWRVPAGAAAPAGELWLSDTSSGATTLLVPALGAQSTAGGYYGDFGWQHFFSWHP